LLIRKDSALVSTCARPWRYNYCFT